MFAPQRSDRANFDTERIMSDLLEKAMESYLNALLPARDAVVREMEAYARKHDVPIVGPACSRVLYQLARCIKAKKIFELGSAIGYSTLWLARAAGPGSTVCYTDSNPANAARAKAYLRRAGVLNRVKILVGDALEMLQATSGTFDLIYIDINKTGYPDALHLALPRLRVGGLLIADNVLWHGKAPHPAPKGDAETRAIRQFNRLIYNSPRLFATIIPLRDGLAVCEKLK
jgi:predicted O-methyltransferase YrrM